MTIAELQQLLRHLVVTAPEGSIDIQRHENNVRVAALTLIGEARGEGYDGRIAVVNTFHNRAADKGRQVADVCLQESQYSCWWGENDNAQYVRGLAAAVWFTRVPLSTHDARLFTLCKYLVGGVLTGALPDNTNGATHYYSPRSMVPVGRVPSWAKDRTPSATVGHSIFYAGVPWN